MFLKKIHYVFLIVLFLNACAAYEPQYRDLENTAEFPTDKEIEKTFYLVGDAGLSPLAGMSEGLTVFNEYMKTQKVPGNYTIFLGDNIYPDGMPPKEAVGRSIAEYYIDAQLKTIENYEGEFFFIPGNHEWYNGGLPGVKREEEYIKVTSGNLNAFQPENGCPLKSISVSDNIQLIMIDSQWYLEDWNANPTINENCDIKSREKLFIEVALEIEKNKNKTILFAMHHPMFTNGTHGGFFGLKKHLYPTQSKLPLPVLSSLVVQIRSQGGVSVQDRYNELYNDLMNRLAAIAKKHGKIVFASGHEHTLQHFESDGLVQILSGSGAKASQASLGKDALFVTGAQGFAVLDVFKDGSSWVRYFIADTQKKPKLVFEKEIFAPLKVYDVDGLPDEFPQTIETPVYRKDTIQESLFFRTIYGKKYEKAYTTSVTAKVADLDTLYGGLTPIRQGGRNEYDELKLKDANGNLYTMRALAKNALEISRQIPTEEATKAGETGSNSEVINTAGFNQDFYTTSHPYAVMAIPRMADAVNIFYTKPELFYVPKQKALQNYNEKFGNELYLISVEPSVESDNDSTFAYPNDVETTDDILIKLRENDDILVDEENYVTSRLFDMLIGDWDREDDHWRWAEYFRAGKNLYVPIPKNRDDAFSSFDGNILDVARSLFSGTREAHIYRPELINHEWFNKEGVILDRAILERSGRSQWTFTAKTMQANLLDEVIDDAFKDLPVSVQDETLEELKEILKKRRDNLVDIANGYFDYLSKLQTLTGTDQDDYIEITRLPKGKTNVKLYETEAGEKGAVIVNRTFDHANTREVWIYGLGGNDVVKTSGEDSDLIYMRFIGGKGTDSFDISEGRRIKFYDHKSRPSKVIQNDGGSLVFSDLYDLNTYDYRKQLEVTKRVAPGFGYNPDDGVKVGLEFIYTVNSFKRNPFSKRHILGAAYYFETSSFDIDYSGEFANTIGDLNLSVGARITSPNYTVNYFGFGNESRNAEATLGYDYNRIELQKNSINVGLLRNSSFGSIFRLQTRFEAIRLNESFNDLYLDKGTTQLENTQYFGSLEAVYSYRSFDNPSNPSRAMLFDLTVGATENISDVDQYFGYIRSRIGFYNALITSEKLVLKTNIQTKFNIGNRFEFYQGAILGGNSGLRGFREERFVGRSSLVGSADVRYSFNEFKIELFPLQIGIYTGGDLGRVWTPIEDSEQWHTSYGGGLWANGPGGVGGTFSLFNSVEGTRFTFGIGLTF